MEVNGNRIKHEMEHLSNYNDTPGDGITRFSYSKNDISVREYLLKQFEDLGLSVRVDSVGNIFATLIGEDPELLPVYCGSHIDSVKNGGMFDGMVGVIAALEVVRVIVTESYRPKRSIVVVIFSEEEGSNFQVPVLGSKVLVGKLGVDDLKSIKNGDGRTAYEIIKAAGFNPDSISQDIIPKGSIKAMVELHIEQSVRLDKEKHPIGIVNGIAGLQWLKVTVKGCSNHAGATPMNLRNDALVATSQMVVDISEGVKTISNTTVATVGHVEIKPNIPNAIPGEVKFTVDIRDIFQENIDRMVGMVFEMATKYSDKYEVQIEVEKLAKSETIKIPEYMLKSMEENAKRRNIDYILMPSGAVHDSNYMASVTDVGMIFVPSIDGRSHVKEEYTSWDDIKLGGDLLLATILDLAT